jgi:hypothetical protein
MNFEKVIAVPVQYYIYYIYYRYINRNFVLCPNCRLCVASRSQLFCRIFSCIFVGSRPETGLIWSNFLYRVKAAA